MDNMNTHVVWNKETRNYDIIDLETGEITSTGNKDGGLLAQYKFNSDMAIAICQEIRLGKTLKEIGNDDRFPDLAVILNWRRHHPVFNDFIDKAKIDRAEGYHDEIVKMAKELSRGMDTKDEVNSKKASIDAYKWLAEKNDPDTYGKKSEVKHSGSNQPTFVISTGIVRQPVEAEVVEEVVDITPKEK